MYFDNIVVYSQTLEEHVEHFAQLLQVLRKNELYVKKVPFLGHLW